MQHILLRENKIDQNIEHFWVIGLANNNRLLFIELVSKRTFNKALVEPMEVFSFALQKRATKIILVHNHPSGELKPSDGNIDITDHLIIYEKGYLSFTDTGLRKGHQRKLKPC